MLEANGWHTTPGSTPTSTLQHQNGSDPNATKTTAAIKSNSPLANTEKRHRVEDGLFMSASQLHVDYEARVPNNKTSQMNSMSVWQKGCHGDICFQPSGRKSSLQQTRLQFIFGMGTKRESVASHSEGGSSSHGWPRQKAKTQCSASTRADSLSW